MPSPISALRVRRRARGRPRKFDVPTRAVTLTLPESVIDRLTSVNTDLSVAVAELTSSRAPAKARPPVDLQVFGRRAVITVVPTKSLERRAGVELVPYSNGRALISFDRPHTIAELELILNDALEDPALVAADRRVFESIVAILHDARRSTRISLLRRSIIVLEARPEPADRGSSGGFEACMPVDKG